MSRKERIRASLSAALNPTEVEIVDESKLHEGHAGASPGGETHYRVRLVSETFAGQSRVARQRAVYAALDAEFACGLHALSLATLTPDEAKTAR